MPGNTGPLTSEQSSDDKADEYVLRMMEITKQFPGVLALDHVDFSLKKGEVHVVIGANGAGKSTLMKILSGAYKKDSGEIWLDGQNVDFNDARHARNLGVAIIYQTFSQVLHLNVMENIFLGREKTKCGFIDFKQMHRDAELALAKIGLSVDVKTPLADLGTAQRQMVEIAKALSFDAKVVVMDEPTSALTGNETETLFSLIKDLKAKGIGIIYISHRIEELKRIGDRVTVMRDGKTVATRSVSEVEIPELIHMMVGNDVNSAPKIGDRATKTGTEYLRVVNLSRDNAFKEISFELHMGEVLGLFGLMGAGCTEIARSLFGVDPIDAGEVFIHGEKAEIHSPADAMKYGLGFLTEDRQDSGLALSMSVGHNISLPSVSGFRRFFDFLDIAKENAAIDGWIAKLGIKTTTARQQIQFLSGGNQQKVVFAKWLMVKSTVLLLDEPTQGIDVVAKSEVHRLIHKFAHETGGAVLLITSELPELLNLCDRVLVVRKGRVEAELIARETNQELVMSHALGTNVRRKG